ncbi:MAG: hypothetical protein ACE369_15905 [Roseovarius sp.]
MTGLHDRDHDVPAPPTRRRRAVFLGLLLLASTLIYAELVLRYSV